MGCGFLVWFFWFLGLVFLKIESVGFGLYVFESYVCLEGSWVLVGVVEGVGILGCVCGGCFFGVMWLFVCFVGLL